MTEAALRKIVLDTLGEHRSGSSSALPPGEDLRDELDIDSKDFLNFVSALHEKVAVDIPEADYPLLGTVDDAVGYLVERFGTFRLIRETS